MKKTSGTAAKKKRSAANANGGISSSPTLIGTKENPHRATTARISARSRGARRAEGTPEITIGPRLHPLGPSGSFPRIWRMIDVYVNVMLAPAGRHYGKLAK